MNKIAKYLNEHIRGAAYGADRILEVYATDRSVVKVKPKVVAVPADAQDVRKIVRFADQLAVRQVHVPVTVRGAGRGKTGGALGSGIIISTEQLNRISEIDPRQRLVRCQAGVTLRQLNSALALYGLTLPVVADPSATIGGLIAEQGAYRAAVDKSLLPSLPGYLEKAELVLASGDIIQTEIVTPKLLARAKAQKSRESAIYRDLADLLTDHKETIGKYLSPSLILPGGYAALAYLAESKNIDFLPLLFGSQGTLAVITEVILRCEYLADAPTYFFALAKSASDAMETAAKIAELQPATLDLYDLSLLDQRDAGKTLRPFATDAARSGYLLAVSLTDLKPRKRRSKLRKFSELVKKSATSTEETAPDFLELHSTLLTYLNDTSRSTRLPLVDGAYVPRKRFGSYLAGLDALEEKYEIKLPVFGSYLHSTYSVRPEVNLSSVTGRQFVLSFLRDYHKMLADLGGAIAGDAPEGRVKAITTVPALDPELLKVYKLLKGVFDPHDILNPGVKHDVNLRSVIHNLRTSYDSGIIT